MRRTLFAAALSLMAVAPLSGQTLWDSPPLVSPVTPAGVSVFLLNPAGGGLGGLVTFRHDAGPVGMGYRFALTDEDVGDGIAVSGGVDISGFLSRAVEGSEVDVMWWSGVGAGIGEEAIVSVPLGAVVGWSGQGGDVILSPYAGGHIALDISTFDQDNVSLNGAFDVGIDVVLSSGWLVRFGGTFGDREALALGVKLGG